MAKNGGTRSGNRIGAVGTAFDIVHELERLDGARVVDVARSLDIPKSTAHVYLKTLREEGYVTKVGTTYAVSLRFLERGGIQRKQREIYRAARHEIDDLSRQTGEVVNLGVEEEGKRVLLYSSEPKGGLFDNSPVGQFTYMHWTALGKAMLANRPDERIEEIVDRHGLPRGSASTVTEYEELLEELDWIRERGFSIEDEERTEGIRAVGVPITDESDEYAVASISISGPKNRITDDRIENELIEQLRRTANVIELKNKHYGPAGPV